MDVKLYFRIIEIFALFLVGKVEYIYVYDRGAKKIGEDCSFRSLHIYIYPSKYTSLLDNMDNFRGKGGFLSKGARKKKRKRKRYSTTGVCEDVFELTRSIIILNGIYIYI